MIGPSKSYYPEWRVSIPEVETPSLRVERFTVSDDDADRYNLSNAFSLGASRMVPPGTFTKVSRRDPTTGRWRLWMSDTDAEVIDHLNFYHTVVRMKARRVLINGLGIGMIVRALLQHSFIDHIDVVEIDTEVAEVIGSYYAKDPRVTIHVADALTIKWPPNTRWDAAWHDIWPTITSDNLEEMSRLHRMYGRRVDYQESWCRWECERERREDRKYSFL